MNKNNKPAGDRPVRISAKELGSHTDADIARLREASSQPIDTSEMPELTEADFRRARHGTGGRQRGVKVVLHLDQEVADKVMSEDPDRINRILRELLLR